MKKKVQITETYTYELEVEVAEDETLDDVIHETENIRFMSEELFNQVTSTDKYHTEFSYEELE